MTVVVATRDRPEPLASALAAIARAAPGGTDVLVVDSAGQSTAAEHVAARAGARYVRAERPGLSVARNLALASTTAVVVAFTDDDCRPRPGWLEPLVAPFADPAVGFATGEVVGAGEGTAADVVGLGEACWRWPDDPLLMGSGANMALRREAALAVGGFDAALGAGAPVPSGEDHDLFLRALHAGWEGRHVPASVVDHHDHRGRWQTVRLCYRYGIGSGVLCHRAQALDRRVARRMVRTRLWERGLRAVARDLRRGWELPAARGLAMTAGVVVGLARRRVAWADSASVAGPDQPRKR